MFSSDDFKAKNSIASVIIPVNSGQSKHGNKSFTKVDVSIQICTGGGCLKKKFKKSFIFRHSFACKMCDYFKITFVAFELKNALNEVSKNV